MELLDSLPVAVTVENAGSAPRTARFPQPAEYRLDLTDPDGKVLWSTFTSPPEGSPSFPVHTRVFPPGTTTLAVYDWNALLSGGSSPLSGTYVLRVRLLTEDPQPESSVHVRFAAPVSPGSINALKPGEPYTLAGTLDPMRQTLSDERGSAHLARRLLGAPLNAIVVVRGFVTVAQDGTRTFGVERWAPLGPQPVSSPASSP
jgi:hypothetical protein